jgi:protein involved in ribonucleotide reduction
MMKRRSLLFTLLTVAITQGALAPLVACGTTTGTRVQLRVNVTSNANAPFTTADGWSVSLSRANVSFGPQYYYDGAVVSALDSVPLLQRMLAPRLALAHPGHYAEGNARGEMLTPARVDLVSGMSTLGVGVGTTGVVRSGTVSFQSAGNVVSVQGVASKGNEVRTFTATLTASEVSDSDGLPEIVGCAFDSSEFTGDGTVTLRIDTAKWFEVVEFERVSRGADGAPVELEGIARNELIRGIRAGNRYSFNFQQD